MSLVEVAGSFDMTVEELVMTSFTQFFCSHIKDT